MEILCLTPVETIAKNCSKTPPLPHPLPEGCCVLLNQRKWILDICTLKEECVCLNTALFKDLAFCVSSHHLDNVDCAETGASLRPGSRGGSQGLAGWGENSVVGDKPGILPQTLQPGAVGGSPRGLLVTAEYGGSLTSRLWLLERR